MDITIHNWPAVCADITSNGVFDLIPLDYASYGFITGSDTGYRISEEVLTTLKRHGQEIPAPLNHKLRRYIEPTRELQA